MNKPEQNNTLSPETITYALRNLETRMGELRTMVKESFDKLERTLDDRLKHRDARTSKLEDDLNNLDRRLGRNEVKTNALWAAAGMLAFGLLGLFWRVISGAGP